MVTWLDGSPGGAGRAAQLEEALARLPTEHLMAPVLRREQVRALFAEAERSGDAGRLREAAELMDAVRAGMDESHPMFRETALLTGGAFVIVAAADPTGEHFERAARALHDAAPSRSGDTRADQGSDRYLSALTGLLHSRRSADRGGRVEEAVQDLVAAVELLPAGHELRPVVIGHLGAVLVDRYVTDGQLAGADNGTLMLDRAVAAVTDEDGDGPAGIFLCASASARLHRASMEYDLAAIAAASTQLRTGLARLPEHDMMRPVFESIQALADTAGALVEQDRDLLVVRLAEAREAMGRTVVGFAPAVTAGLGALLGVLDGMARDDAAAIASGIDRMEADLAAGPVVLPEQRIGQRWMLGKAYLMALGVHGRPDAAERAVLHLTAARNLLAEYPAAMRGGEILKDAAHAHRARDGAGDREQSRRAAFESLAGYAGAVLLQSGVAHAVVTARGAAEEASVLAGWCLDDGDVAGAVLALELGRGLTLHASTSALRVPELLRGMNSSGLAQVWEQEIEVRRTPVDPTDLDWARAADDLRQRVLALLRDTPEGARLFTAPTTEEIGRAVAAVGADVLAYLTPGHILLITPDGEPRTVAAPALRTEPDGPLQIYLRALQSGPPSGTAVRGVCDWAGLAVVEPLRAELDRIGAREPGEPYRVVLVPGGPLGAVPWSAARVAGPGGPRYACADMVLSTAASARQLIDVAVREGLPPGRDPVLVTGGTGDLPGAVEEVLVLQQVFFPDALVLGDLVGVELSGHELRTGPGTPEEVLRHLPATDAPGASLLHVSGRAVSGPSAEASWLALTARLTVLEILEHAAGRPADARGPLVVLAACRTDLAEHDHDEALTLATAFLVAGAVTVVGSRWEVDDRLTAVLMFAFHHFLTTAGSGAADALRSAQLWMLDPDRAELPGMPEALLGDMDEGDLTDVTVWAAFGHHGR